MLPPRDIQIIHLVALYDTLTRAQINRELFPDDHTGRITRKRLRVVTDLGLLNQTAMRVTNPSINGGVTAPVYYPSARGMAFLNEGRADNEAPYLLNTTSPHWMYLYHHVAVAETHLMLTAAVKLRPDVKLLHWYGERALADPIAKEPEKRFKLYSVVAEMPRRIVNVPDAGFLLEKNNFRRVFYLEQDRDTTKSAERVAAQKCGGYAGLFAKQLHRTTFPEANSEKFTVLVLAPTEKRRDALRKAFAAKPNADLYRFGSLSNLRAETFLSEPIWHDNSGEPKALVQRGES